MADLASRLRLLRSQEKLSQADLAQIIGVSKSSINMYERGEREPSFETVEAMADYFNVSMSYMLGTTVDPLNYDDGDLIASIPPSYMEACDGDVRKAIAMMLAVDSESLSPPSNIIPLPATRQVPLLGAIACGEPILAEENIEDYIGMPEHIHADFCLRCQGDSMVGARILDGDIVYIRQQPDVQDGEIAAVLIDGEATLKRVYKYPNKLVLQPENPSYAPMVYVGEELEEIRIIGKAVAFLSTAR